MECENGQVKEDIFFVFIVFNNFENMVGIGFEKNKFFYDDFKFFGFIVIVVGAFCMSVGQFVFDDVNI